jgi:hypothetical protein
MLSRKQVSYIRALEKIVSNVVPATDPMSLSQTAQSQLLLIKENQELQDALLRMRKKVSYVFGASFGAFVRFQHCLVTLGLS